MAVERPVRTSRSQAISHPGPHPADEIAPHLIKLPVGTGKSILGSGGDLVFVDESADAVSAVHARRSRHGAWRDRWTLIERPVRAMVVVVLNVRLQDGLRATVADLLPFGS
jgi:hypothetical protein